MIIKLFGFNIKLPLYVNKEKGFEIAQYKFPEVFGRLWEDAENKNDRLREIQVKRAIKTRDDYDILHPQAINVSSGHVNLDELQEAGVTNRKALEDQILQSLMNEQTQAHFSNAFRNEKSFTVKNYPSLLTRKSSKDKDGSWKIHNRSESPCCIPTHKEESNLLEESQYFQQINPKSNNGPFVKRHFNFLREIKVVPYNIATIENILTK